MPNASPPAISFMFEGHPLRMVERDGAPWFVGQDACDALGLTNNRDALSKLAADEKGVGEIDTPGGRQQVGLVSEGGLYTLILRCRDAMKEGSVPYRMRRWVTGDVLPTIRKTGGYGQAAAPQFLIPATLADALQLAADQQRQLQHQAEHIDHLTPKAIALERIAGVTGTLSLRESAKILGRREQEFIRDLNARKIIYRRPGQAGWLGYADKEHAGLLEHKHSTVERRDGSEKSVAQVRLTTKLLTRLAEQQAGGQGDLLQ